MSLNPLDFYGPQFLLFYLCYGTLVVGSATVIRRRFEAYEITSRIENELAADPYLIAFLREGTAHLVGVTVLSLLDRGLLTAHKSQLQTADGLNSVETARRPIEKAVLQRCMVPTSVTALTQDPNIAVVCEQMAGQLRAWGLLPDMYDTPRRLMLLGGGMLLLWMATLMKIAVAFARGHHNIGFLLILSVAATITLLVFLLKRRTSAGDRALARMKTMFARLPSHANHLKLGGASTELVLLAAVFGFAVLPSSVMHPLRPLHLGGPETSNTSSSDGGGGGSSCGGGGCGGGCGGCG